MGYDIMPLMSSESYRVYLYTIGAARVVAFMGRAHLCLSASGNCNTIDFSVRFSAIFCVFFCAVFLFFLFGFSVLVFLVGFPILFSVPVLNLLGF
jgi:hypothetical protein